MLCVSQIMMKWKPKVADEVLSALLGHPLLARLEPLANAT